MQSIVRKAVRPFTVVLKGIILVLIICATGGAWAVAPTPTAVWEAGEFDQTKGGYSISLNGNTINEGGNIVIKSDASAGVTIDVTDVLGNAGRDMSVLIKYSNATAPTSQAVFTCVLNDNSGTYDTGFISSANNAGTLVGYWNKTSPYTLKNSGVNKYPNPASTGSGCFLYSYKNKTGDGVTKGVYGYNGTTIATLDGGSNDGLCWPDRRLHKIAIGGPSGSIADTYAVWPNLIIEKVAIFVGNAYSNADIAGYRWPSEIKAVLPDRDMINLNISNADGYAITGSGGDTIPTLAGEMLDNAWQNTPSGNAVVSGDARNGRVTGVTAYDGTSKEATTLSDVTFTWAVEGSGTANYGNVAIENNPTFHKAWLARLNKAAETSSILVQSIPYRKYDIIVYCFGADDSAFNPVFVNGVPYVGDTSLATDTKTRKATSSSETWGGRRASPSLGQTAIMLKGLENPELSLTIRSGVTSICAVQILRDMSEGVWPTSKKVISLNLMSAKSSSGSTPAIYGLEPVPDAAWTKDGLSTISSSGTDVSATIKEWNGTSAVDATGVTVNEKAANAWDWSDYTYAPQNQILSGYLDDGSRATITVTSVPYAVYDVIVYMATDTENFKFGPVKVNDVPYRWDDESGETVVADSADSTATTRWGASRSRLPAYGLNAIRVPNQTSSTLTIIGANNANDARGGIAAIQIVEAHSGAQVYSNGSWSGGAEPTSGDAVIVLDGDTALAIDGTVSLDTVTIIGTGTLTLSGSGKFTATTIEVNSLATVNANPDRLDATTYVGSGTVVYSGGTPETGKGWTDSANWTGTVEIKGKASTTPTLKLADYGNSESAVCVNGFEAYISLDEGAHAVKELKIGSGGFTQVGDYGYNATKDFVIPAKLTGSGTYTVYMTGNATKTIYFIGDVSEFSGKIAFNASTESSRVVMGSETDRGFANKSLVVGDGVTLNIVTDYDGANIEVLYVDQGGTVDTTINASSSYLAAKSFVVDGILKTEGVDSSRYRNIGPSPAVVAIGDTGELVLYGSSSDNNNFSKVTGTGTIRYAGTSWRSFPDSNPFADTLTVAVYQADGIAYSGSNGSTKTIGSIFGTKNLRTDLGGSNKTLIIKQAKDGEWSGVFSGGGNNPDRLSTFVVQPGSSAAGTLKLSGAQTQSNDIQIDAGAKVNLTGTWVGAATVSGTFGGTGTLTGNLTFNTGSTFKAFASDENGLSVSGTVTTPGSGTVTVDVSAISESITASGVTLISGGVSEVGTFVVDSAYRLDVDGSALKVYPAVTYVAEYNGVQYEAVQEAIDAAEQAGQTYAAVTILDPAAPCPDGYYIDTDNSNILAKYQAAYVLTDSTVAYYKTAQLAVEGLEALVPGTSIKFDHFEVYDGSNVAMSMNPAQIVWATLQKPFKVKCLNGATVAVTINSVEFDLSAGDPDENGIVTYTKTNKATTYVWVATSAQAYARPSYWKVGSAEGATATRTPDATDTVVIGNGASLSGLSTSWNVAALRVSGTVAFIGDGGGTLTSASAITLGASDSITITGTLSPEPTAADTTNYRVRKTTDAGTTTYTVVDKVGTIFSVY